MFAVNIILVVPTIISVYIEVETDAQRPLQCDIYKYIYI